MNRLTFMLMVFLPVFAFAQAEPEHPTISGQILKYETRSGGMLVDSSVDWSGYTRLQVDTATVEFREDWAKDQERLNKYVITDGDLARIKKDMSDLLNKVLTEEIAKQDGYELTDASGPDVLRLTPGIAKLDIHSPGRVQNFVGEVLVGSQGSMIVVMDISDSVSGKVLASSWQRQVDPEDSFMETATVATNMTAFRSMMDRWSTWFFELLDYVQEHSQ